MGKKGVLLVNLGTPDSPSVADVRRYLDEFLMDGRVIDIHPVWRNLLVRGVIVPFRSAQSAKLYKEIWSDETGSPLMYYSIQQAKLLQERLGEEYHVEMGMRYQNPSIESALEKLRLAQVDSIRVLPLFPHYASATTGSVLEKVMELVRQWHTIPNISFINSFHNNELMIETFVENAGKYQPEKFDHVLFSFHGLPQRQLTKADYSKHQCLQSADCCANLTEQNKFCYSAQCYDTARLMAQKMGLDPSKYTVCFQSRLGKDPWAQPYTSDVIKELAAQGKKRVLVFCPAFVADCLETIHEISVEYAQEFKELGGEEMQLVESLNNHPKWIEAMEGLVKQGC